MRWLTNLRDTAAELQQARLTIEQGATTTRDEPDPALAAAHAQIVSATLRTLGPDYAHQVRQWDDMYRAVLETYTTSRLDRREKLAAFSRHFASLFITRHPAYPLFRHWESVIEQLPSDEIEDGATALEAPAYDYASAHAPAYLEDDRDPEPAALRSARAGGDLPWNWIIAAVLVVLIGAMGFGILRTMGDNDNEPPATQAPRSTEVVVPPPLPTTTTPETVAAVLPPPTRESLTETPTEAVPTLSPVPTMALPTPEPTQAPTDLPSATPTESGPPTETPTPFVTNTFIPSSTPTETPTVPATQSGPDMLAALVALPSAVLPGPAGALAPGTDGKWTLSTAAGGIGPLNIEFTPDLLG